MTVSNTSDVLVVPPLRMPRIPALPVAYAAAALLFVVAVMRVLRAGVAGDCRRSVFASAIMQFALGLVYASGCGGGGPTVQPPSNATLRVTGVSASVSHMASLNLTVNH